MMHAARRRIRATDCPILSVPLAPETMLSIMRAAQAAGMTPDQLAADVLRDMFEPVFESRGAMAVKEAGK